MALREPVGPILGIAPWNAPIILGVRAIAVPLACGNTVILKASEMCPRTHALIVEAFVDGGLPGRRGQPRHQRARGCRRGGRRADRPSRGPADQLHRLDRGGPDHRQARRRASEAGAARARRQGAADRARGCRSRRGGQGGGVRRVHEPGPDLHVDRADHRRRRGRRRLRREVRAPRPRRWPCGDPREGKTPLGAVVDRKTVEPRQRADRRRARPRARRALDRRQVGRRADARAPSSTASPAR